MTPVDPFPSNSSIPDKIYCCFFDFSQPNTGGGWWGIYPPSEWNDNKFPDMFPETYPYPYPKDKNPVWPVPYIEPFEEDPEVTKKWKEALEQYQKQINKPMVKTEWTENKGYYSAEFQIPGFKKEHVTIELKERVLSLRASREDGKYTDKVKTLTLPSDADETNIAAKVEDGILTITVAKITPPVAKKIVVN